MFKCNYQKIQKVYPSLNTIITTKDESGSVDSVEHEYSFTEFEPNKAPTLSELVSAQNTGRLNSVQPISGFSYDNRPAFDIDKHRYQDLSDLGDMINSCKDGIDEIRDEIKRNASNKDTDVSIKTESVAPTEN